MTYHAAVSVLDGVDRVQRRLLRELGLTELESLMRCRLAPLPSRRDIFVMGVLHKVVLGLALPQLAGCFPFCGDVAEQFGRQRLRVGAKLHS